MDTIDSAEGSPISAEALNSIIEHEQIITHFQPIISLKSRSLLGVEALSRGLDGQGKIVPPRTLFAAARSQGKAVALDRLCRNKAIHQFCCIQTNGQCGRAPLLFLNFDTSLLDRGVAGSGFLRKQVSRLNVPPSQVIIEIVENQVKDVDALGRFIHDYRNQGFIIALDDVGAGYSNLDRITIIKPDIIKIDRSIISDINRDYYKQEIFKALVRLSRKIGTLVLAEGVENIEECLCVLNYDADLLQGFFFAKPAALLSIFSAELNGIASHTADRFREWKINKIKKISDQYRTFHEIIEGIQSTLAVNLQDRFETILKTVIEDLPLVEAVYILDKNGIMVTNTVLRKCWQAKPNMLFQKAEQGDNLSLKEYFYLIMSAGLPNYVTDSYISWATGNLTRTISASFKGLSENMYVLCIDILVDPLFDNGSYGDEKRPVSL